MMKLLRKEHEGSQAVESVVQFPLMFMSMIILLYFFFMVLAFISYGNVANSIAKDLNMRQTGYQTAMKNYSKMPEIRTYLVAKDYDKNKNALLAEKNVIISPNTQELRAGTYASMSKYKGQFIIPFTEVQGITVETSKPVRLANGRKQAGTVIKVSVNYSSTIFGSESNNWAVKLIAVGYNVID